MQNEITMHVERMKYNHLECVMTNVVIGTKSNVAILNGCRNYPEDQ